MPAWCRSGTVATRRSPSLADLAQALRDSPPREFLGAMFGNEPLAWRETAARRQSGCASRSTR
jgi:hypothetical protein